MILFLNVISPKPEFVLLDNNKIVESLPILDHDSDKVSDHIQHKFKKFEKKNNFLDMLDCLVVCRGPGSYTSLRVCISFMLGISYSKNIHIYGPSCIDLLNKSILDKDFNTTIIVICSANNQNFICIPCVKKYHQYTTYKINDKYTFNNINLKVYSKCIFNYPLAEGLRENLSIDIDCLKYTDLKENLIKFSSLILIKQSILQPIYISENKLFD